ncbi:dolichyl-P-Glc:Glc1Man9GlcNAc2-PP-dolichol alpha-1,3-glucosyltransferase [Malassezia obtusa]|uniref:Alpha-1,3-glucosyltransferase n=1 Tax=Malassezia obtusa TaxID=76774 RepID=A0AAF0DZ90_9BASI|nr:dolichyl-P-Glc:Glc1Man9GlcNAc2-PP-dolichol alpha-1,3-glucosyltransferase [Malassezia obtusa]
MDAPGATALVFGTLTKILLWPAYHSTDMEVHRNWLAITYSLPLREWYFEATSEWTLDYPPFFAYLSWLLAQPAAWIDARIVDVQALGYADWPCKAYMRATVLVTELVLAGALYAHARCSPHSEADRILLLSVLLHPGLLIVDHIHFQYNGVLYGVMLWSLYAARAQRPLLCAVLFSSLLNLKHIYLYVAPAWIVYLFRAYLFPDVPRTTPQIHAALSRVAKLGAATLAPFVLSIVPFVLDAVQEPGAQAVLGAMYGRLFPFHRGLIHAYWAPNVWALYTALDRVLLALNKTAALPSASRGIVGDTVFGILPDIRPPVCFVLALGFASLYAVRLWQRPTYRALVLCVTLCGLTSFAIGWHVHEKAILLAVLPLSLVTSYSYAYLRAWEILSAVAIVSLFPLLYQPLETPVKLIYSAIWFVLVRHALHRRILRPMSSNAGVIVHFLENKYLDGLALLALLTNVVWPLITAWAPHLASPRIEFLPLMATSVYCAAGVVWVWLRLSLTYWRDPFEDKTKTT